MTPRVSADPGFSDSYARDVDYISRNETPINAPKVVPLHSTTVTFSDKQPQSEDSHGEAESVADTTSDDEEADRKSSTPGIRYFRSYLGNAGEEIEKQEVSSLGELGHSSYGDAVSVSPIELIWPVKLNVDTWAEFEANKGKAVPPVVSSGPYVLRINSPAIIMVLQESIDYWPNFDASLGSLDIVEPFMMLYHYRTELEDYTNEKLAEIQTSPQDQVCERQKGLQDHMKALFQFLDNRPEALQVAQERQRHQGEVPSYTFDTLWLMYKPGTIVISNFDEDGPIPRAYVVHSVYGGATASRREALGIRIWYIDSDGYGMGRQLSHQSLVPHDEEYRVSAGHFIPWDMYKVEKAGELSEAAKALREQLVGYGKLFVQAFGRKCVDFDGSSFTQPETKVVNRVIIDHETYSKEEGTKLIAYKLEDSMRLMPACTCPVCASSATRAIPQPKAPYQEFDNNWSMSSVHDNIDESQQDNFYMLCTPRIFAYLPGLRVWRQLHISGAKEPDWNTFMIDNRLVMDSANLKTIKALAYRYTQWNSGVRTEAEEKSKEHALLADKPWAADFVSKKGDSIIMLLHGKPGVGKTYTAECVSEFVRRPLLSLTCTDIGTEAEIVETRLAEFFRRAELWGAVILLDEADIFLEQRTLHDLQRNSLVSAFLRSLEYFQGILFLTTNRVGTFDDAFLSRIHVVLHYEFEEAERKQVWKMFFSKLAREREQSIRIHETARSYIEHNEDLKALSWNGRDIRNAFQTAVALAESEAISQGKTDGKVELTRDHFEQVVAMSRNFKQYLQKVHGQETEKAAATRKDRHEYTRQRRD